MVNIQGQASNIVPEIEPLTIHFLALNAYYYENRKII